MHGVSDGGDIGHDKEATGSHPGPSLYVWVFRANRKMLMDKLLLFLRRIQMEGLVNEIKKSTNEGRERRVDKGGEEWI